MHASGAGALAACLTVTTISAMLGSTESFVKESSEGRVREGAAQPPDATLKSFAITPGKLQVRLTGHFSLTPATACSCRFLTRVRSSVRSRRSSRW